MQHDEFRIPRQHFVVGAGLALTATALAACTSYGNKPAATGEPTTATPTTTGAATPAPANAIAKTADVPVGSGVIVDEVVVTQPSAGVFNGFSAICTHAGCTVNEVADGTINCPCHGSRYNLDGSVVKGPATGPLESKTVSLQGDSIVLS